MAITGIATPADNIVSALIQSTLSKSLGRRDPLSLFLGQLSSSAGPDLAALLRQVTSNLVNLSTAAAVLDLANPTSTFFATVASSSNTGVITAQTVSGISLDTTAPAGAYSFTVSQVAVTQSNVGTALSSNQTNGFTTGTNTFQVAQNGVNTNVSFTVGAADTNLTVLTNMAAAINNTQGLGVSASVNTDQVAGTSRLVVQSKVTGTTNAFTLTNVSQTPVTNAGVGTATTAAVNASYTQNGVALSSQTNDFYLGSNANLHVTLLNTTASSVVVTVGPDTSQLQGAITTLVNAFNTAKAFFDGQADLYPGASLQLNSAVFRLTGQLSGIGINVAGDGSLSVDSTKLASVLVKSPTQVQAALGDVGGLAKNLHSIADTLLQNPLGLAEPSPPPGQPGLPRVLAAAFADRVASQQLNGLLVSIIA